MNDTLFDSMPPSTYHHPSVGLSKSQILNIVQCGIGGLILVVNLIFLIILAIGRWRLQRPKRYALSANISLADVISGFVLVALALTVLFEWYGGNMIRLLLETVMSANFAMCTLSCNAILRIQYVAVRQPWRYFLYLTKARLFAMIVLIWTIAHASAFAKGYVLFFQTTTYAFTLAICELAIMAGGWVINLISFIFVLRVAVKKVRSHDSERRHQSKNRQATARLIKDSKNGPADEEDETRYCCSPKSEYAFLITVGLNLLIFFLSFVPLWIDWIMGLYSGREVYFDQRTSLTRHLLLLVCFLRAAFEPIVHVLRQPKLICGNQYSDSSD